MMQLCYRGCKYQQKPRLTRTFNSSVASKYVRYVKYRGVAYQFYQVPLASERLKNQFRYRGVYLRGEGIDLTQDLTIAAVQIQKVLEKLQERGMNIEQSIEVLAKHIVSRIRRNPYHKKNLLTWGQSLADSNIDDVIKSIVNRALIDLV